MPYVLENVVIMQNKKLTALIYPNYDKAKTDNLSKESLIEIIKNHKKEINKNIPAYMQISEIIVRDKEFEKTPKQSIKRYLYQEN